MPASWDFLEREAAKAWGLDWAGWCEQGVLTRADCLAHEFERNIREAYAMEKAGKKSGGKGEGFVNAFEEMRRRRGLK